MLSGLRSDHSKAHQPFGDSGPGGERGAVRKQPRAMSQLVVIVGIPIATVRKYGVSIFSGVVHDAFPASPVCSVGRIAGAFIRGEVREHT